MARKSQIDVAHAGVLEPEVLSAIEEFVDACRPIEQSLVVLRDNRTEAVYIEAHILGSALCTLGTIDVPLDPDEQGEYRANRDLREDHVAFERMKDDAADGRSFSNIVCEYSTGINPDYPLGIIGGQHRFDAVRSALESNVNQFHGVKVYFGLDNDQRLDVQLISNTNIEVSPDLWDRMLETVKGPELRDWCQKVGFLDKGQDFADRRVRGHALTVRAARTFILNYFDGRKVKSSDFDNSETTPSVATSGSSDAKWEELRQSQKGIWTDKGLLAAGKAFAKLIQAQRDAWADKPGVKGGKSSQADFREKALNFAVIGGWAFVAGALYDNKARLDRHYALASTGKPDPLNAAALAKGRHRTDSDNYRGLGYRTDAKERGRFAELFFLQAEDGAGINKAKVDLAIKKFHAKEAMLDVRRSSK